MHKRVCDTQYKERRFIMMIVLGFIILFILTKGGAFAMQECVETSIQIYYEHSDLLVLPYHAL